VPDGQALAAAAAAVASAGLAAGFLSGLFGIGAGVVLVPALSLVLPVVGIDEAVRQKLAVATSLAAMIPTSWLGARQHHARGALDLGLVRSLAAAMLAGAVAGALLVVRLRGEVLSLVFAAVAAAVACQLALTGVEWRLRERFPGGVAGQSIGFALGLVAALMGIGGGTVGVPVLTMLGVPILRAVAAASAFGLVIALPATAVVMLAVQDPAMPPFSVGYVSLPALAVIVPFSMLATGAGVRLAHRLRHIVLRRAFAGFLLLVAARMAQTALG